MLDAIKELGDFVKERDNLSDVEIFIENPKFNETEGRLICLKFKELKGKYEYSTSHAEDIDEEKLLKCLYTESGGQKINTFSLNLGKANVESTIRKVERWLKSHEEDSVLIKNIYKAFKNDKDKIKEDIKEKLSLGSFIVTMKIINNEEKFLGELDEIKALFKRDNINKLYKRKYRKEVESKSMGNCFFCGNDDEVYGFAAPFEFYTVDKRGFAPNLNQEDTWKQMPVCFNCAVSLRTGRKKFLDKSSSLSFSFIDALKNNKKIWIQCYIIPKFIFKSRIPDFIDELESIEEETTGSTEDLSYEIEQETGLIDMFSSQGDILKLCFLYYTKEQARMVIQSYIEEVPPSWIKRLRETMEEVQNLTIFQEEILSKIVGEKNIDTFRFKRIGIIGKGKTKPFISVFRDFFPSSKTEGTYNKYFIQVVSSILSGRNLNKDFIIFAFVRMIRGAYRKNRRELKILCMKAFMLHLFLIKADLLMGEKMEVKKTVVTTEEKDLERKIETFFVEYGFDNPAKKAAFSVGILVDRLLWVQWKERGAKFGEEPFWSSLYGLVLDEKKVKRLFPKALSKLRQYGRGYPDLEMIIGKQLGASEKDWNISNDETSYYFTLGMTLGRIFLVKK